MQSDWGGTKSPIKEFFWMLRYGSWCWGRNLSEHWLYFGRTWHDGPIWVLHIGPLSVSLNVE